MSLHVATGLTAVLLGVVQPPPGPPSLPSDVPAARQALLDAEDARASTPAQLATLVAGLTHADVAVRLQAVRALGRLEDPAIIPRMAGTLDDPSLEVRIEAAHALAQSAVTVDATPEVFRTLSARLAVEVDGGVRGAIAAGLGRLPYGPSVDRTDAVTALQRLVAPAASTASRPSVFTLIGVARGAEALARGCARDRAPCEALVELLEGLLGTGRGEASSVVAPVVAARVRRLAASGITALDAASPATRQAMVTDVDAEVRRIAMLSLAPAPSTTEASALGWLKDESWLVRHAVVQRAGDRWPSLATQALVDANPHVRLAAIDALGNARACTTCAAIMAAAPPAPGSWHVFGHALVALARTSPALAAGPVEDAARSDVWQVRMYAARAAGEGVQIAVLRVLARDMHPNVREAALAGLSAAGHRESDDLRIEALGSNDYQLVLTAARTLEGTPRREEAQAALLAALTRLTGGGRDTSRDTRLALIDRLEEVGDATVSDALRPWLDDADRVVAERIARHIETRAGRRAALQPAPPLAREPLPSLDEIARLETQQVVLTLRGLGEVTIRLASREAPVNVARFARQVAAGAWNGLTFHRVAPGFVVQGGSPGANEYAGADRFTRDERSHLSHVRGSVGISTRGRDTGDGQIFINLVDNPRLDNAYTVIGTVTAGMTLVDGMLEGAVIERARLVGP